MIGVDYMNDDPAEVDVLYGRVYAKDGSHILQDIADGVVNYFWDKGLYRYCSSSVFLHVSNFNLLPYKLLTFWHLNFTFNFSTLCR
jgi:activating signal cointegrator complex subunit 1